MKACWIELELASTPVMTVEKAIDAWLEHKEATKAWGKRTFERTGADVRAFGGDGMQSPVSVVNVAWVRTYLGRIGELALASQQSRFHAVSEFLTWCVKRGHLTVNPAAEIDDSEKAWMGKRARRKMGRGKPQLRNVAEVRAYLAAAAKADSATDRVAAVLPLLTGMRSGEVRHLRVGDVDFDADRLWIRDQDDDENGEEGWCVKSAAGRRTVDLPELLRADFVSLCGEKDPDGFVFVSNRGDRGAFERKWLNRLVQRVCAEAKTRVICAHGLRDTFTSLMAEVARKSPAEIAKLVGHADQGKTAKKHYIGVAEHHAGLTLLQGGARS
ncbi:MAG: tyrosine-type recombinase/integrase [Myxococcales bacterium]|nr:tyrosine-type recombinase/integrase [Myxococcales bacterium]